MKQHKKNILAKFWEPWRGSAIERDDTAPPLFQVMRGSIWRVLVPLTVTTTLMMLYVLIASVPLLAMPLLTARLIFAFLWIGVLRTGWVMCDAIVEIYESSWAQSQRMVDNSFK